MTEIKVTDRPASNAEEPPVCHCQCWLSLNFMAYYGGWASGACGCSCPPTISDSESYWISIAWGSRPRWSGSFSLHLVFSCFLMDVLKYLIEEREGMDSKTRHNRLFDIIKACLASYRRLKAQPGSLPFKHNGIAFLNLHTKQLPPSRR